MEKSRRLLPGHLHLHRPLRRNRPRRPRGQRPRRQHRRRALVGPRLPSRRKDALGEAFTLGRIHPRSARLRRTRRRHAPQRHQPTPGRPHRHLPDARRALWPAPERRPPGPEPHAPHEGSRPVLGSPRAHHPPSRQSRCPQRALALHSLRQRRRRALRPPQRPPRVPQSRRRTPLRRDHRGPATTHPEGNRPLRTPAAEAEVHPGLRLVPALRSAGTATFT